MCSHCQRWAARGAPAHSHSHHFLFPALRPALKQAHHPLHGTVVEASRRARTWACTRPPPPVVSVVGVALVVVGYPYSYREANSDYLYFGAKGDDAALAEEEALELEVANSDATGRRRCEGVRCSCGRVGRLGLHPHPRLPSPSAPRRRQHDTGGPCIGVKPTRRKGEWLPWRRGSSSEAVEVEERDMDAEDMRSS
ncbi:hypothetical protein K438DRAFT_1938404 [Mycena galopus ATCC 62051]|nr:hypothetical protein K438DRAFT_1938404 [Mycena galopus ATCC 62051]